MKRSWSASHGLALALAWGVMGCTTNEDRCEELCEWLDDCVEAECSQEDIEDCASDIDTAGSDCEDAVDEFLSCVDDADSCNGTVESCQGEAREMGEKCEIGSTDSDSDSSDSGGPSGPDSSG